MALSSLFEEWQDRLGLSHWTIRWSLTDRAALGANHGDVRVWPLKHCASIRLLDPCLPDVEEVEPYDPEVALVHELLHCQLWTFRGPRHSVDNLVQEQSIHELSKLLVSQQRQLRALSPRRRAARSLRVVEFPAA